MDKARVVLIAAIILLILGSAVHLVQASECSRVRPWRPTPTSPPIPQPTISVLMIPSDGYDLTIEPIGGK